MTKPITWAAAAVALAASFQAPAPVAAAEDPGNPGIIIVNHNAARVSAVIVDRDGRHHRLGRVGASRTAEFDAGALGLEGPVQVKVFIDEPAWSAGNTGEAVRSAPLQLDELAAVQVWVEPTLTETTIQVVR